MPVTNYVWDPLSDNVLLETDDNDVTQAVYTQEPDTFGHLISQRRDDETSWYHFDGLGSTRELTDDSETVTDTNMYDAWGVDVASTGTTGNPFRWVGELGYYDDPETGDYYVRARMYQPTIARWTSMDQLFEFDSSYSYVGAEPMRLRDPSGLFSDTYGGGPGPPFDVLSIGSCEGCIIVFFLGKDGNPTTATTGMRIAATDAKAPRHFVAVSKNDADEDIETKLSDMISRNCNTRIRTSKQMCAIFVGHSYGGDEAIEMVDWFHGKVASSCPALTPVTSLVTVDAIQRRRSRLPVDTEPTSAVATFLNYFQTALYGGVAVQLSGGGITKRKAATKNIDVSPSPLHDWMRRTSFPHSPHRAIDDFVASENIVEAKKLGEWVKNEADRLEALP